ncbi:MAG: SAM-dependent methyltransferase [Sneathiella sp.]|nr:SAM-dependent methyltransferase [Sneathiella sp.]
MTELSDILKARIADTGPISMFEYMDMALAHPKFGYYQNTDPFGKNGDFITAPEISQMFGELIGLWCVDCWIKLGTPSHFHLMELGPGNGTLMCDALRSSALAPDFLNAAKIHMVESSERLANIQQKNLSSYAVQWHSEIPKFEDGPIIVIANEFFDALPIQQFERHEGKWFERLITVEDNFFSYTTAEKPTETDLFKFSENTVFEEESIAEVNPLAREIVSFLATIISEQGGAALCIDYGPMESALGDSFQAVQNHKFVDALQTPGSADLTAHVDFKTLSDIAKNLGCSSLPLSTQGRFLERLGIEARFWQLSKNADAYQKEKIANDMKRLISTQEMGTLFKALSFYSGMQEPPSGFGE